MTKRTAPGDQENGRGPSSVPGRRSGMSPHLDEGAAAANSGTPSSSARKASDGRSPGALIPLLAAGATTGVLDLSGPGAAERPGGSLPPARTGRHPGRCDSSPGAQIGAGAVLILTGVFITILGGGVGPSAALGTIGAGLLVLDARMPPPSIPAAQHATHPDHARTGIDTGWHQHDRLLRRRPRRGIRLQRIRQRGTRRLYSNRTSGRGAILSAMPRTGLSDCCSHPSRRR